MSAYIVVFDDGEIISVPMSWASDCAGALICQFGKADVAMFYSRPEAQKAIRVSAAFARLRQAQGKPANDDFLEGRRFIRILRCATQADTTTKEQA